MENETEVIRHQMEETRTSLTEKLEKLEDKVLSKVEGTTEAVTETVATVQEAVQHTVEAVTDSVEHTVKKVKETFDLRRQVESHPWLMFGGAIAAGFAGGQLLGRGSRLPFTSYGRGSAGYAGSGGSASSYAPPQRSWLEGLAQTLAPTLDKVKGLAVGAATGLLGEMIMPSVPDALRDQVTEVLDSFATSLGGKPIHGLTSQDQDQHRSL